MEMVREKKMARMMVGVVRLMFYHLDLHQEFWCLRPAECCFPLIEEGAGVFTRLKG